MSYSTTNDIEKNAALLDEEYFANIRETQFERLDRDHHVYLDYTGGNLYPQSLLQKHFDLLSNNTFGNPHSTNPTSQLATKLIDQTRQKVIDFFNAEDYFCVFTQNASGALKIVGECYPFNENSQFLMFADNHNSVNGIREYVHSRGGEYDYCPLRSDDLRIDENVLLEKLQDKKEGDSLFAFPAQSNVSGVKHSKKWIQKAQDLGWDVLLDAAAYVPSSPLDLKEIQPDFVSISFYKMFGYPTGIGCLFIKKSKFEKLHKRWFAGGTVMLVTVNTPSHLLVENHERFENGTLNYLGIPCIYHGLTWMEEIGMNRIKQRVNSMITYLCKKLCEVKHKTGVHQVKIFGPLDRRKTGGTMIMSFMNPDGTLIPYEVIEEMANKEKISIRTGCFCNPGIDEVNSCVTTDEIARYFTKLKSVSSYELIAEIKHLRGAVRVSVGIPTTKKDLDTFIRFVNSLKDKFYH